MATYKAKSTCCLPTGTNNNESLSATDFVIHFTKIIQITHNTKLKQ